jgi:hypothetical protein
VTKLIVQALLAAQSGTSAVLPVPERQQSGGAHDDTDDLGSKMWRRLYSLLERDGQGRCRSDAHARCRGSNQTGGYGRVGPPYRRGSCPRLRSENRSQAVRCSWDQLIFSDIPSPFCFSESAPTVDPPSARYSCAVSMRRCVLACARPSCAWAKRRSASITSRIPELPA